MGKPGGLPIVKELSFGLAATEAFAAVEAFVAGAVADGHVTAVGAGGSVLLEMRD